MWLMLQQQNPDDYIVATGEAHSVRDFVERAVAAADLGWPRHVEIAGGEEGRVCRSGTRRRRGGKQLTAMGEAA
jgi:GDP-D-mannose dehydratase